ncbi:MAG TPA: ABC transporter permease [Candidatus Limnocylindrales bacterium]|nr:ABC transporter permease [Candidatus Limnocylindrales bacterium]
MGELRAALAIAHKDLRMWTRYPASAAGQVFVPLYQGLIPAILFGTAFLVDGRAVGLESITGTADLAGFVFLGSVMAGLVSSAFWQMGFGLRSDMDMGTLEPAWLTPTRRETFVLGRTLSSIPILVLSQTILLAVAYWLFRPAFSIEIVRAVPALALALVSLVGVGYLVAAGVLLMREAGFFVDTTNFLFHSASGSAFPVTVLPGAIQVLSFALPTTYALDLLRHHALGSRTLLDPGLEHLVLLGLALLAYPFGLRAFLAAERRVRVTGALGQH